MSIEGWGFSQKLSFLWLTSWHSKKQTELTSKGTMERESINWSYQFELDIGSDSYY